MNRIVSILKFTTLLFLFFTIGCSKDNSDDTTSEYPIVFTLGEQKIKLHRDEINCTILNSEQKIYFQVEKEDLSFHLQFKEENINLHWKDDLVSTVYGIHYNTPNILFLNLKKDLDKLPQGGYHLSQDGAMKITKFNGDKISLTFDGTVISKAKAYKFNGNIKNLPITNTFD